MRVFITGATGFVGRYIVEELLNRGYEVHAGVRNINKLERKFGDRVRGFLVDFDSKESIREAFKASKPDYLIHLIGILFEERSKGLTFHRVHSVYSENIFSVAVDSGVKKICYMSALGTDDRAPSMYHQTKRWAEKYLSDSEIRWTIFRPSMILGPEQRLFRDMDTITKLLPVVALPGGGSYRFQPVDVRDVACAFSESLDKEETDSKIIELCGSKEVSFKELLGDIFNLMNRRVLMIPLPKQLMFYMAKVVERILEPPPFSSDQMLMMWRDNVCGEGQIFQKVCGRDPIPYEESIAWSVREYMRRRDAGS